VAPVPRACCLNLIAFSLTVAVNRVGPKQSAASSDVRFAPKADKHQIVSACPLCADFVAEVRCKLFWSVIPSL
jgi:hypothetical protein